MPVVTIRGQAASGALQIGQIVADRLHVDYVSRQVIAEVAARLRRHEQDVMEKEMPPGTVLGRIAEALGRAHTFEGVGLPAWEIPLDDTRYLQALESVIKDLAASRSIVIRGRGSQFILRGYPGVLHVLVVAPLPVRVKRTMENLKLAEDDARREITRIDNSRREFIRRYFRAELEDPVHYDLVVNTGQFSYDAAASIVIEALAFKDPGTRGQAKTG